MFTLDKAFILTIDQSTSGTKALVVDRSGRIVAHSSAAHRQYYPRPGWVEHDPLDIYEQVKRTARLALQAAGIGPGALAALTVTNQRETAVMWSSATGKPAYPAIVWQCQRTADMCAGLNARDGSLEQRIAAKTGLRLDPYFSASKWGWILDNVPESRRLLERGELLAGTIDSWLLWKLSGGACHKTDYTNASRTLLFNIHDRQWDAELCGLFGVPAGVLPTVHSSDDVFGYTNDPALWPERVPISGVVGDSQAALFGQLCLDPGTAKATYGTGTSVLMNVGERPADANKGLVLTIARGLSGHIHYALEAVIRSSGDTMNWVRDSLGLFADYAELEQLLRQAPDNEGVYVVPAFVGLGAPYWNPYARAAITGLSRSAGKAHIVRAALESVAYQVRDAAELMQSVTGVTLGDLYADGGGASNKTLMQFQADLLNQQVRQSDVAELSALGAAYIGGLGVGVWSSTEELVRLPRVYQTFAPAMNASRRRELYNGWQRAVSSVLHASVQPSRS